ncbi:hypothetical protein [Variovorax sp. GT1P44]|uniref:hypothetical protein n=1 Tax=Variovorax sp. GT1P44 TaxID=3443742 RepID=UPI003F48C161
MADEKSDESSARDPVLSPVDRVSEMLFGLFMALTFVGAVSVAESGREDVRKMFVAALGCNLAWGLVDAVMYLVRTITDRGRWISLVRSVRITADAELGRGLIAGALSKVGARFVGPQELEAIRNRMIALPSVPDRPRLRGGDLLAAVAIFFIVVAATFPVVLPFALVTDIGTAKWATRAIALVMLFLGGLALGRYAGYGSWKVGLIMAGLGAVLVVAVILLGG